MANPIYISFEYTPEPSPEAPRAPQRFTVELDKQTASADLRTDRINTTVSDSRIESGTTTTRLEGTI